MTHDELLDGVDAATELVTISTCVETYQGRRLDLADPDPSTVSIVDIAHALGMQCRYNGHCKRFFSVAEHSVFCSRWLELTDYPVRLQLLALLHDAAEAYLGDLILPAKPLFPGYAAREAKVEAVIYEALKIEPPTEDEHQFVKLADNVALATEASVLMPSAGQGWRLAASAAEEPKIDCLAPPLAAVAFVERFHELGGVAE